MVVQQFLETCYHAVVFLCFMLDGVPFGKLLVVLGEGAGSYCLSRSQYWV